MGIPILNSRGRSKYRVIGMFVIVGTIASVSYAVWRKTGTGHAIRKEEGGPIFVSAPIQSKAIKSSKSPDPHELSPAEREQFLNGIADETREKNAWYARATLFEKELTRADVLRITDGFPNSFFRRVGIFTTQNVFRKRCSREDYEALKRTMPLETLHERALYIFMLVQLYDERHLSDYIRRIRASWSVDARWKEFRDLDRYYAEIDTLHTAVKRTDAEYGEKIAAIEAGLVKSGVSKETVVDDVLRMAASHPNCLGPLGSSSLYSWLNQDLTKERGNYFLGLLRGYWSREHQLPNDLSALVPAGHPMRRRVEDAWYNDFRIVEENALEFGLFSNGPDREPGTSDDIRIGTIKK